jgi:8-oxo-dGTP pyrophosphatase MutT (NUDIX family)
MSFDIPRGIILPVEAIDVRLDPAPHPFETGNGAAIAANWRREIVLKPALFDGTVVLLSSLAYRDRTLTGVCHAVRYSTFMYWRGRRERSGAEHAFAHAMLVSGDDALVAIRNGMHTVNGGRVYFAAGSFEPEDFPNGIVDVDRNMMREAREETGLDLGAARRGRRCHVLATVKGTVIFRRFRLDLPAEEIARRISAFAASEPEPEIDGPVVIRNAADLPEGLMPHMKPLIDWHFAGNE